MLQQLPRTTDGMTEESDVVCVERKGRVIRPARKFDILYICSVNGRYVGFFVNGDGQVIGEDGYARYIGMIDGCDHIAVGDNIFDDGLIS